MLTDGLTVSLYYTSYKLYYYNLFLIKHSLKSSSYSPSKFPNQNPRWICTNSWVSLRRRRISRSVQGYGVNPDCCQLAVVNNTIKAGVSIDDDALFNYMHNQTQCLTQFTTNGHSAGFVQKSVLCVTAGSMWTYFRSRCYVSMSNLLFLFRKTSGLVMLFVYLWKKIVWRWIEGNHVVTKLIWQPSC